MRVVFDVRWCLGPGAGVQTYSIELLRALHQRDDVEPVMWFAGRQVETLAPRLAPELRALEPPLPLCTTRLSNALLYTPAAQEVWRRWPARLPPPRWLPPAELYHAPYLPLPLEPRRPLVLTVHDLLGLRHPAWATAEMRAQLQTIRRLAPRAALVLCDSEATRRDALELCDLEPARVRTIPLGVAERFGQPVDPGLEARLRVQYGLTRPFIVSLGTIEPRKNMARLIDAYDLLCERHGGLWDLVLIGQQGWGDEVVAPRLSRARRGRIHLTGRVRGDHLPALLAAAEVMAYPSLGEGFGLPPLEAMAAGCPVVTSNCSSLPEVVGEAAVLVEPTDHEAICDGLQQVLTDEATAAGLRARGRERAAGFTWQRTAAATVEAYRDALAAGR